ncbi:MAG: GAF domain-containing protein [Gammaproteobacteria bacterium]|nr:GAF domain-containing protein [Gammaproteobacteria bacterium]
MYDKVPEPNFYNVKILRIYVAYLRNELNWDSAKIEQLFESCHTDIGILEYDDNWFNQDLADCFHDQIVAMTGDQDISHKVGVYSTHHSAKGIAGRVLVGLLSPSAAYRNISKISAEYTKGAVFTAERIWSNHATIRSVPDSHCHEKLYHCRNRLGILESIPTFFRLPSAIIEHPKCIHKGDEYCEYEVTWIEQPYKYAPILAVLTFIAMLVTIYLRTSSPSFSFLLSLGIAGIVYAIFNRLSYQRLNRALNEQIEALRISHDTLERRHKESSLVSEINLYVNRMIPIENLCQLVTQTIHDKMGYDRVTIFLHEPEQNILRPAAHTGFNENDAEFLRRSRFKIRADNTDGFLIAVMNTGNSIFVRNAERVIDTLSLRSQEFVKRLNVKSFTAVPIKFEDTIFGVLAVDNITPAKLLTENDRQLLESVAMPIGVSFSNAKSYEKLQNSKNLLEDLVSERTQELVIARDEAVRANSAKSLFLANMSHELRTPLNAIMGFSQLIHLEASENHQEQIVEDCEKVINSSKHLLSLISDLLDMSKIEAGKMELYIDRVDVKRLVTEVREIATELAKPNRNEFTLFVEDEMGTMLTDEKKLKQILLNLISNACKFTNDGNISLSVTMDPDKSGFVLFEVKDTGIGIPKDKLSLLFQDFTQVDSSTSRNYGGTGLGLSLSKKFCEMMGGEIELDSLENIGSTFYMSLPKEVRTTNLSGSKKASVHNLQQKTDES